MINTGAPLQNDAVNLLVLGFLPSFSVIFACYWEISHWFSCFRLLFHSVNFSVLESRVIGGLCYVLCVLLWRSGIFERF